MNKEPSISIPISKLPLKLKIYGKRGKEKIYELRAASRHFGAFLCTPKEEEGRND